MIRINLLPADLRRGNRIPAAVLAASFGAAVAVSGAVGWFGLVYFGDLGDSEQSLVEFETRLVDREKIANYHDQLATNKTDYAARVQTIQGIGKSRRLWSKFCDELVDVVNNNGDTERHLAWFGSIVVKDDPKKGPTVTLPASLQDDDTTRLANFHDDIEAAPFASFLTSKSDPSWSVDKDEARVPPASLTFPLALQFKPPVVEAAPKGAGKAPAKTEAKTPAKK